MKSVATQLAEIRVRVEVRHEENQRQFAALVQGQKDMDAKLDSLLATRSFTRGVWKAAATSGGLVSGIVAILALIVQWWRGH